jgi:predicted nuclease with TOPRIM domain
MSELENHTLALLHEIRDQMNQNFKKVDDRFEQMEKRFKNLEKKVDNVRQAAFGESVLGRYAAAEVEGRPDSLEKRVSQIEQTH